MSEELIQMHPKKLGRYLYYRLGNSTLGQLKKHKIVKLPVSASNTNKKPDGLIVLPGGIVKAVIEYKTPSQFRTQKQIKKAIDQELSVAADICNLLIVTSGKKTCWINANNGEEILNENGDKLAVIFDSKVIEEGSINNEQIRDLESLIDKIDHSVSSECNKIHSPEVLDPSNLAKTIWQKIWINTGKEPEKCLYNVVELFVFKFSSFQVFKFLSDVGVLGSHADFQSVFTLISSASRNDALKHYAGICRKEIRELFPSGDDGTTVINGTIFVNEQGEPNLAQSNLFAEVLGHLQDYDSEYGSFRYIQKEFKTRLYESFLRQEAGIKHLGQYFTPRNVVKAMVEMSGAEALTDGARVCDPFCGVGGFLLEMIAENDHIRNEFTPKNGKVSPRIKIVGYDKGSDEKEDERTIILAKANMLIYFSDLLLQYNSKEHLKSFADGAFNDVFRLLRSNLGTFGLADDNPYDLILTNPPYVTSGSSSLKRAIIDQGLEDSYTFGGRGTESLALEWIIRNLKPGGEALVVVPDGLLNQVNMLAEISFHCTVRAIISLPNRTFYSTPKKTYILVITKKFNLAATQNTSVFTYLVSEIGESRDAKRFSIDENDLEEASLLFRQFDVATEKFVSSSPRCKIIKWDDFNELQHWMIDRLWDQEEKESLGVVEEKSQLSIVEFNDLLTQLSNDSAETRSDLVDVDFDMGGIETRNVQLSDDAYFTLSIGNRVLKKDIVDSGIPVFSANVNKPFGYVEVTNIDFFDSPSILWGIDGIFDYSFIEEGIEFATTDHCGLLRIEEQKIYPKYIFHMLRASKGS